MADQTAFAYQQGVVDDIKSEDRPRVKDSVIEQLIKNATGEARAEQDPEYWYFRPLVAIPYDDGTVLKGEQCLELIRYSNFAGKKMLMHEIRSGRVIGKIENRQLTLERPDAH